MTLVLFALQQKNIGGRDRASLLFIVADFLARLLQSNVTKNLFKTKPVSFNFKDVPNQARQVKLAKKSASDLVDEWNNQLGYASVCIYSSAEESEQILAKEISLSIRFRTEKKTV